MSRVILTGNPIWARDVNTTQYCGDPNKKDFGNVGVLNPKTDLGANQHARLVAELDHCRAQFASNAIGVHSQRDGTLHVRAMLHASLVAAGNLARRRRDSPGLS